MSLKHVEHVPKGPLSKAEQRGVRGGTRTPAQRRGGRVALVEPFVETSDNTYPDGTPKVKPKVAYPPEKTENEPPASADAEKKSTTKE